MKIKGSVLVCKISRIVKVSVIIYLEREIFASNYTILASWSQRKNYLGEIHPNFGFNAFPPQRVYICRYERNISFESSESLNMLKYDGRYAGYSGLQDYTVIVANTYVHNSHTSLPISKNGKT